MEMQLDEKKLIVTISDKQLIEKLQNLGGLLYDEDKITFLEAAYFAEKGVLEIEKDKLLKLSKKKDKLALDKYEVLRFLRNAGYIVRCSLDGSEFMRVYQKGFRPNEDRTKYVFKVINQSKTNMEDIEEAIAFANRVRKELVFAYIKNGIRFIKINRVNFL